MKSKINPYFWSERRSCAAQVALQKGHHIFTTALYNWTLLDGLMDIMIHEECQKLPSIAMWKRRPWGKRQHSHLSYKTNAQNIYYIITVLIVLTDYWLFCDKKNLNMTWWTVTKISWAEQSRTWEWEWNIGEFSWTKLSCENRRECVHNWPWLYGFSPCIISVFVLSKCCTSPP